MRVWIDITNSPHVPFFRPLIALLRADGHEVEVTAREYAQTLELLELHGIAHDVVGPRHGGAGIARQGARARRPPRRPAPLRQGRGFDVALAHGSHELTLAARSLGIPSATAHDYEYATLQHQLGLPRSDAGRLPRGDPRRAARPARREAAEAPALPGDQGGVLPRRLRARPRRRSRASTRTQVLAVVRTPPEVSLYHRHGNPLFAGVLDRLGRDESVHAVVLPRTAEQRDGDPRPRPAVAARPRARRRRAEPRRARRPRRLGRRHDEPRGGRARHARLHDVRRADSAPSTSSSSARAGCCRSRPRPALELRKRAPAERGARAARPPSTARLLLSAPSRQ